MCMLFVQLLHQSIHMMDWNLESFGKASHAVQKRRHSKKLQGRQLNNSLTTATVGQSQPRSHLSYYLEVVDINSVVGRRCTSRRVRNPLFQRANSWWGYLLHVLVGRNSWRLYCHPPCPHLMCSDGPRPNRGKRWCVGPKKECRRRKKQVGILNNQLCYHSLKQK